MGSQRSDNWPLGITGNKVRWPAMGWPLNATRNAKRLETALREWAPRLAGETLASQ